MRGETSGLLFTQNKDGSIIVEVIDYDVSEFGGDWECRFDIDKENANALFEELKKLHDGTFEEMLFAEFDKGLDILKFEAFCKEHHIEYHRSTWS